MSREDADTTDEMSRSLENLAIRVARHAAQMDGVVAIAQGGSSARGSAGLDEASDLDLYTFVNVPLELSVREALMHALGVVERKEFVVDYWGASDQWVDEKSGRHVDLMYFEAAWMRDEIEGVLDRGRVRLGYTTAFCYTMAHAKALFDPQGWLEEIQRKCREPFPDQLRRGIVAVNHRAARGILSSYEAQIRKAVARHDEVSINHRVAALVASYFDIIFAVNRQFHPGEKRLIALAEVLCHERPPMMKRDLVAVLARCDDPAVVTSVARLLDNLDDFLAGTGLLSN
jgi:hypothetical protein